MRNQSITQTTTKSATGGILVLDTAASVFKLIIKLRKIELKREELGKDCELKKQQLLLDHEVTMKAITEAADIAREKIDIIAQSLKNALRKTASELEFSRTKSTKSLQELDEVIRIICEEKHLDETRWSFYYSMFTEILKSLDKQEERRKNLLNKSLDKIYSLKQSVTLPSLKSFQRLTSDKTLNS